MKLLTIFHPKENSIHVMEKFFSLSNVQVTRSTKEKCPYSDPGFPYFLIVSDILTFYKTRNVCFVTSSYRLSKMPFPFYHSILMRKDILAKSKGACTL